MTSEDLLKLRYKVIADYPQPPYNEGDKHKFIETDVLIKCNVNGMPTFRRYGRLGHMSVGVPCISNPEMYPKIFHPLQWWEERNAGDLPAYVKWNYNPRVDNVNVKGLVEKVIKWVEGGHGVIIGESMAIATCHWLPATREEYEQSKKSKNE